MLKNNQPKSKPVPSPLSPPRGNQSRPSLNNHRNPHNQDQRAAQQRNSNRLHKQNRNTVNNPLTTHADEGAAQFPSPRPNQRSSGEKKNSQKIQSFTATRSRKRGTTFIKKKKIVPWRSIDGLGMKTKEFLERERGGEEKAGETRRRFVEREEGRYRPRRRLAWEGGQVEEARKDY